MSVPRHPSPHLVRQSSVTTSASIYIPPTSRYNMTAAIRMCIGVSCSNPSGTLQCPTCLKLGKTSFFCSQDCFKNSWVRRTRSTSHSPFRSPPLSPNVSPLKPPYIGALQRRRLTYSLPRSSPFRLPFLNLQSEHKAIHKKPTTGKSSLFQSLKDLTLPVPLVIDPVTGLYDPFPAFPYTGNLRPTYPLSPLRTLPSSIKRPDYAVDGVPRSEYALGSSSRKISILSPSECEGMRKVCRLAREVLDIAAAAAKPGVTTDDIDAIVHQACIDRKV